MTGDGLGPGDVTVVIPVRDGEAFIADALQSLLAQDAGCPGIVVVDDGSTDGTAEVVRSVAPSGRLIPSRGRGPGAARNTGVAATTTAVVAFLDADDRWPLDRLGADLAHLDADPRAGILLGRSAIVADDPALLAPLVFDGDDQTALLHHFGAASARRAAFDRVGPIAEDMESYEDYDWFLRAREVEAGLVVHDRIAQLHRYRPGSMSRLAPAEPRALLGTLQRSLRRRRTAGRATDLPQVGDLRTGPGEEQG